MLEAENENALSLVNADQAPRAQTRPLPRPEMAAKLGSPGLSDTRGTIDWGAALPRILAGLAGLLAAALLAGLVLGGFWQGLSLALAGFLAWHLYNLYRLEQWLRQGPALSPPESRGLWAVVFERLYRIRRADRQRKRRLTTLLRQFRRATAALPDGAVVLDNEDQVLWFNSAAGRFLGLEQHADVGQPIGNVVRHPAFTAWLRNRAPAETLPMTSPVDGNLRLQLRLIPYTLDERLLIARDVTHLHRLEQIRKDFVANASHELRTPLTVVNGYLEALEEDAPAEWRDAIREMQDQARRMRSIIEDLLTLSRLDTADRPASEMPVRMTELADSIMSDVRTLSDGRHTLEASIESGLDLRGEHQDLRSAFANLAVNAVRYTQDGGTIRIRWYSEGDGACFEVADNGPGIPAQHIPRLTERFYRVSPSRSRGTGGTGLGLSIVKHVLASHQAELIIDSTVGHGSIFKCRFPADRLIRRNS